MVTTVSANGMLRDRAGARRSEESPRRSATDHWWCRWHGVRCRLWCFTWDEVAIQVRSSHCLQLLWTSGQRGQRRCCDFVHGVIGKPDKGLTDFEALDSLHLPLPLLRERQIRRVRTLNGCLILDHVLDCHRVHTAEDARRVLRIYPACLEDHFDADVLERPSQPVTGL